MWNGLLYKKKSSPSTYHPNYTTISTTSLLSFIFFDLFYLPLLSFVYILFIVIISVHSSTLVCLTFDAFYTYLFITLPLYLFTFYLSSSLPLFNTLISLSLFLFTSTSIFNHQTSNLKPIPTIHNATQSERLQFHTGKQSQQQ